MSTLELTPMPLPLNVYIVYGGFLIERKQRKGDNFRLGDRDRLAVSMSRRARARARRLLFSLPEEKEGRRNLLGSLQL